MNRMQERTWIFGVFLVLTCLSAVFEAIVLYTLITSKDLSFIKGAVGILNGSVLVLMGRKFLSLVEKTLFKSKDLVTEDDLKSYFSGKFDQIENLNADNWVTREFLRGILTEVLQMTERLLQNWVGSYRYELSVFSNSSYPDIIAYYETGGQKKPRSKIMRDQDPEYYRKNNYKVIELLDNPSHEIVVISKTDRPESEYTFVNEEQKGKIKSTLLYTFCVSSPRAIVITCDHPNGIKKDDSRLITLVNSIGLAMHCDCHWVNKCNPVAGETQEVSG